MKHIALFITALRGGGAERVLLILAKELAARGHKVDLVLAKSEGPLYSELPEGVRCVELGVRRLPCALPGLVRYLRTERPTTVMSMLRGPNVLLTLAHRVARSSSRLVLSEHSLIHYWREHEQVEDVALTMRWVMRRVYPLADAVITPSHDVARQLKSRIGVPDIKVKVIPNPFELHALYAASAASPPELVASALKPIILGVGRLVERKNFSDLIKAFSQLRRRRPASLIILGSGPERGALMNLVDRLNVRDVLFCDYVLNPYPFIRAANVLVSTSLHESFGNIFVEALAIGTPVVAFDCPGGVREILAEGKYGTLVPMHQLDVLALAIDAAVDQPCCSSTDGQRRAQDFDATLVVSAYEETIFPPSSIG